MIDMTRIRIRISAGFFDTFLRLIVEKHGENVSFSCDFPCLTLYRFQDVFSPEAQITKSAALNSIVKVNLECFRLAYSAGVFKGLCLDHGHFTNDLFQRFFDFVATSRLSLANKESQHSGPVYSTKGDMVEEVMEEGAAVGSLPEIHFPAAGTPSKNADQNVLFLKNLPPEVSVTSVEAMCRSCPGFLKLIVSEPVPTKRFQRIAWAFFTVETNMDSTLRLLDDHQNNASFLLHFVVHKPPDEAVRLVHETFSRAARLEHDIRQAARLVRALDAFREITASPLGLDELVRTAEAGASVASLKKALDLLIAYLRLVHITCYYCGHWYEDAHEMMQKCGKAHLRANGKTPGNHGAASWERTVDDKSEQRLKALQWQRSSQHLKSWPRELDLFNEEHTTTLEKEKFECRLCKKLFKGPEFVHKHLATKHEDEIAHRRSDVEAFNAFVRSAWPILDHYQRFGASAESRSDDRRRSAGESSSARRHVDRDNYGGAGRYDRLLIA